MLEKVQALPIKDCLEFDLQNTVKVNGKDLNADESIQFREGAMSLGKNWTYRTIKEQLAFEAIKIGIHSSQNTEQLLFSKAVLWVQQREMELITKLSGQSEENDL